VEEIEFKPKFPFEALAILTVALFGVGFGFTIFIPTLFGTQSVIETSSDFFSLFFIFLVGWLFMVFIAYLSYLTHKVKISKLTLKLLYRNFTGKWSSKDINLNDVDSMESYMKVVGKMIMSYINVIYKDGRKETITSSGLTHESMQYIKDHFSHIKFGPRISKVFKLNS
jgi:hypothetical protein